jgi:murein DD-endopeptidase MepM/ murein hydrolase activator NlpD
MRKRIVSCLLSILLVLSLFGTSFSSTAHAVSQEEIDQLRAERLAIAEEHAEKQAVVDELKAEKASILERKQAMDERNELARREIQNLQDEISLYDQMIAEEAIKVEHAKAAEEQQLERYRTHVRAMEENGELTYLALILRVNNLNELLTAVDDAGAIMHSDQELYDDYMAARENTEAVKAEYELKKAELEAAQEELREEQAALEEEIKEASKLVADLEADIDERSEELNQLLLAEIETSEKLEMLIAQQEQERRAQQEREWYYNNGGGNAGGGDDNSGNNGGGNAGGGTVVGSGSFSWPCPGCTYVTSRAGNRFHPIFNEWRYHSGIDIGASYGSAIIASDSGTVILAEVNGGYGNCIMIDHGNSYYTLYGHLSGYAVSAGQAVTKGQTIGYVGDTGWATGPHLHFEIRFGSTCLDPEAAAGFTGLSYAPDAGE